MAGTLLNNTIDKTDANQQLASTINQGGLLMRMAKSQGAQAAGSRGLMNSSIGSEASQRAMVDAAMTTSQQNTQFAQNKALNQQNSDLTLQRDAKQQGYNKENMGLQFGYSTKLNDQQNTFQASQSALDRSQQITMENLQQKNQLGLLDAQGKQELAQLEQQFKNQTALNTQQNTFTSGQNALDRNQQITMQNLEQKNQLGLLDAQGKQQLAQLQQQFKNQTSLNSQQNTFTAQQSAIDRTQQTNLQNDAQSFSASQSALDRQQQITMQNLEQKNQLGLLDAQGKQQLAQLQQQFKNQTSLNSQQNTFTAQQSAIDRTQQTNLQNDQQSFQSQQSLLDRMQQTNLANQQYQNQTKLNAQQNKATTQRDAALFGYDQKNKATEFANSLKTMSQQQKNDLQKLNAQTAASKDLAAKQQQYTLTNTAKQVAANTQGMYLDAINGLTSTFGDQVAAINASSMSAKDKKNSVNSLISAQNSMLKFYQSTYQNMSTIKDDWINVDVKKLPTGSIAKLK